MVGWYLKKGGNYGTCRRKIEVSIHQVGGIDFSEVQEPTVMEDHHALTSISMKLFVAIDAIDEKLIRTRRKQSPRTMRALAIRHLLTAFF